MGCFKNKKKYRVKTLSHIGVNACVVHSHHRPKTDAVAVSVMFNQWKRGFIKLHVVTAWPTYLKHLSDDVVHCPNLTMLTTQLKSNRLFCCLWFRVCSCFGFGLRLAATEYECACLEFHHSHCQCTISLASGVRYVSDNSNRVWGGVSVADFYISSPFSIAVPHFVFLSFLPEQLDTNSWRFLHPKKQKHTWLHTKISLL